MINQYISTYVKDKTQIPVYINSQQVVSQSNLPFGINLVFPLSPELITNLEQFFVIKFINLISTTPGERIMFPDYGVDFQIQLFNNDPASIVNGIQASLQTKLQKYLPQVKITNISVLSLDIQNHFLSLQF